MIERLTSSEIAIVVALARRGGTTRAISLEPWRRPRVVPLWRRGLVEIWYRQSPTAEPSLQGPYYALSIAGAFLASSFFPAPRGPSGQPQEINS